jgi:hypothetical protein
MVMRPRSSWLNQATADIPAKISSKAPSAIPADVATEWSLASFMTTRSYSGASLDGSRRKAYCPRDGR